MFFIFGTPRSGTTLLARCLNAHPDLVIPHETDFLVPMAFILDRVRDEYAGRRLVAELIVNSSAFAASLGEFLDPRRVHEILHSAAYHPAAMANALFAAIADQAGARLAGDKSPNDLNFVRILDKTGVLAAPARIIHIVRDIRDVMVSLQRTGWAAGLDDYFPRQWSNNNLYLHGAYRDMPASYLFLRYEDFVAAPASKLQRICDFLGVAFVEDMLDARKREHPRYRGMAFHDRLPQAITGASIGQHHGTLTPAQASAYRRQAGEAMEAFGYA